MNQSSPQDVELFLHQQSKEPKVLTAQSDQPLVDVLRSAGVGDFDEKLLVFVGEPVVEEIDDEERDLHETVEVTNKIADLGIGKTGHLHCYRCRKVGVAVNYKCDTVKRRFPSTATVQHVLRWARRKLGLTDSDAENLVLRLCDCDGRLQLTQRLGELTNAPDCSVSFDLVHDQRVEG